MSVGLALVMAAMAARLAVAVWAVQWRRKPAQPSPAAVPETLQPAPRPMLSEELSVPDLPAYAPPEGSLWTAQLEPGQTFYVQTATATYILTLLDPVIGRYEAVRLGPKQGKLAKERFQMLFKGTFVPDHGLRFREFTLGGNLCYDKIRDGAVLHVSPSSKVLRIFFSLPDEAYQQAS